MILNFLESHVGQYDSAADNGECRGRPERCRHEVQARTLRFQVVERETPLVPDGRGRTHARDLQSALGAGKGSHVHFGPSRLVALIGEPPAVSADRGRMLVERSAYK